MRLSFLFDCFERIPVPVGPLEKPAEPGRNVFHETLSRLNVEEASRPNGHPSDMSAGIFSRRDSGPDPVSGLKAEVGFRPGQNPSRESERIQPGPLIGAPSRGLDRKARTIPALDPVDIPDTSRVQAMGFRESEAGPVVFRPASGGDLDRKPRSL